MKARMVCISVLQVMKDHRIETKLLYPAKLSLVIEGERKAYYY